MLRLGSSVWKCSNELFSICWTVLDSVKLLFASADRVYGLRYSIPKDHGRWFTAKTNPGRGMNTAEIRLGKPLEIVEMIPTTSPFTNNSAIWCFRTDDGSCLAAIVYEYF